MPPAPATVNPPLLRHRSQKFDIAVPKQLSAFAKHTYSLATILVTFTADEAFPARAVNIFIKDALHGTETNIKKVPNGRRGHFPDGTDRKCG